MKILRRGSRIVKIGKVYIGGNHPIAIQSMVKTKPADIEKSARQIKELESVGCEIVRLSIKDSADARALKKIKPKVRLPLVADIHFDWRLAIEAIEAGADKIRLNPGNIYKEREIKEVISALKAHKIPLRIGVNSGSVKSSRTSMADKLVWAALNYIKTIERLKFYDIIISLKGSGVLETIEAYRKISKLCDYPLHLGVTATGLPQAGAIKSSIAIASLLLAGIGDTIRVSLTDKPTEEVKAAKYILEALGLRSFGPQIISCPTCGRCEVDLVGIVRAFENKLSTIDYRQLSRPLKVAIMGCVVNGPGEARQADIGVAFGKREGLLFEKGRVIKKILPEECADILWRKINQRG